MTYIPIFLSYACSERNSRNTCNTYKEIVSMMSSVGHVGPKTTRPNSLVCSITLGTNKFLTRTDVPIIYLGYRHLRSTYLTKF